MTGALGVLVVGLVLLFAGGLAKAFSLPLAKVTVRTWTWLYTAGLPYEVKSRRREEVSSDVWEHESATRASGYSPDAIGLQIQLRGLLGMPSDVEWLIRHGPVEFGTFAALGLLALTGIGSLYIATFGGNSQETLDTPWMIVVAAGSLSMIGLLLLTRKTFAAQASTAAPPASGRGPDYILVGTVFGLASIGILAMYFVGSPLGSPSFADPSYFAVRQTISVLVGMALLLFFTRIDYHLLRRFSVPLMLVAIVALVLVLIPRIGHEYQEYYGAQRWLMLDWLPPIKPSELAKFAFILYLASWLAGRRSDLTSFAKGFVPFLSFTFAVALLVVLEPDSTTALLILAASASLFFVAGARPLHLVGLALVPGAAVVFLVASGWGIGYETNELGMALHEGGVTGGGLGFSYDEFYTPSVLSHGVVAVIGLQLGFVGTGMITLLYVFILYRALRIARHASDDFGRFLAFGIAFFIASHVALSFAGTTGVLPLMAVDAPFLSYAYGSWGVVWLFASIGVLLNISRSPTGLHLELRSAGTRSP